ncbi:hypothetical protein CVT24_008478 [Panaeolus cyanescens]|uniref:F-box domain-containing protein n=1 Tax=Panaeolus cyanescens TaxID=181874 RepID=A0A409VBU0_9AGAR|nr:hypothetical protein CVT24_008478 [Panaeolus cyanescens]
MSTPDFPVEIWQHIASFLPPDFVETLFSVNRAFLQIALDTRYRVARVSNFDRYGIQRTLLDQDVRHRARSILIDDDWEKAPVSTRSSEDKKERSGRFRSILAKLSFQQRAHEIPATTTSSEEYYEALVLLVPELKGINEVDLRLYAPQKEQYSLKLRLANVLLETAGSNLTKLSIHIGLEDLHQVFPNNPFLPNLSKFRIVLRASNETPNPESLLLAVVQPFLVNQRDTVHSLELIGAHTVDPSVLLQSLPHFPRLVQLYLSHHIRNGDPEPRQGFTEFMKIHAPQLHDFRYHMRGSPFIHHYPPQWFVDASNATLVDFPRITQLTVSVVPRFVFTSSNMISHIQRYRATLRTLRLQISPLSYTEILDLLECISGSQSLQSVNLLVDCLAPAVLGQFATHLPMLEDLTLNFVHTFVSVFISPFSNPTRSPLEETHPDAIEQLKMWRLVSLSLVPVASRLALLSEVRRAIVRSLPRVRSFCEVDPEEYASAISDPGMHLTGVQAFNFGERY